MVADWEKVLNKQLRKSWQLTSPFFCTKINSFRLFFRGSVIFSRISYSSSEISFREVNVSKIQSGSCCRISNNFFLSFSMIWDGTLPAAIVPVFCRPGNELWNCFNAETQVWFCFFFFLKGARTNNHQLPKNQKIILPKSLDVDSAKNKSCPTCASCDRNPF